MDTTHFEAVLEKRILIYPAEAQKAGIKGRVFLSFIVHKDGQITDVNVLKGLGSGCDEEAIRLVKAMPRWTPGSQDGQPLNVRYNWPISFGMPYPKAGENTQNFTTGTPGGTPLRPFPKTTRISGRYERIDAVPY